METKKRKGATGSSNASPWASVPHHKVLADRDGRPVCIVDGFRHQGAHCKHCESSCVRLLA